ncbi:MAG: bifunctional 5,10-methylenetetrahydrofolate dehydrogenase/5,10-methenyltetrahydrofolate cyclohydrolase [Bacillota bacterium]
MAVLLDGKKIAAEIKEEIKGQVVKWRERGVKPSLVAVLAGDDPGAVVYAKAKGRVCEALGIDYRVLQLAAGTSEAELLSTLCGLSEDPAVHGIVLELPLPAHIDKHKMMEAISPLKDVDGVHPLNRGYLMAGCRGLYPATPQSCIEILLRSGIEIAGRHVVVIGRGETVGKPLIFMLLENNATVTVCHTKTRDLTRHTLLADIIIAAAGRPRLVTGSMVSEGAVVVDAGINPCPGGICGDVAFDEVEPKAGAITPVPGGVGSLTTTILLRNLLQAVELQNGGLQ